MSFYHFRLLSSVAQCYWALRRGTHLADRWEQEGVVNLYHCADEGRGWFVELRYDQTADVLAVSRRGETSELLADYAAGVRLPEE